ncbi:MAG: GGDEF domain-containing protein [Gammaproteobacteria bacterium]|nr:GGDEF domain-containing protein [Gammaproteobacteria bacterium]
MESVDHHRSDHSLTKRTVLPLSLMPAPQWALVTTLTLFLVTISFYNYLLFHTLVELIAIVIAILLSIVVWQTYPISQNHFLAYLGSGYIWVAALDFMHTVVYKGMSIFPVLDANPATQFWISSRYMEALLLISAPFFLTRPVRRDLSIYLFGTVATATFILIITGNFPDAFIEGRGLTPFKVISEYIVIGILAGALLYMWRQQLHIDRNILLLMTASIILSMCAELSFTLYVSVYGLSNLTGHIFKLFSYWFIYEAIIRTTLKEPVRLLSRNLHKEMDERRELEEKLRYQAAHDPLTGLYNRSMLEQRLADEVSRATRYESNFSLFMLDIDHFKKVNDTHGHLVGDNVLCNISKLLDGVIRNSDYIARYGGEEFVVILPETAITKAEELAERLRSKVEAYSMSTEDNKPLNLTVSIGIATFPDHAQTPEELIKSADTAMYRAKNRGRNRVCTSSNRSNLD